MQICTLLTRSRCKVPDSQVTVKACGPLVYTSTRIPVLCSEGTGQGTCMISLYFSSSMVP